MLESPNELYAYKKLVGIPAIEMIDDVASIERCGMKYLVANSKINAYIEMKKLTLNDTKCKQIHIGNLNNVCPELKVHGSKIDRTEKEKYLGDQISSNCLNKIDIMERKNKSIGLISEIMMLLYDISCFSSVACARLSQCFSLAIYSSVFTPKFLNLP